MAAANSKNDALSSAQIGKLETELKTAFKEGRFETVRKKAEEIRKSDPKNRTAERILQKVQEEEASALKKTNALKTKALEAKIDQSLSAGNLAAMTQAVEEVKKIDPANSKALKAEATLAKAKEVLEAEMRKEQIRKLSAEVEFFANKADWNSATAKANEILSLEWDNSVALKALRKAAVAKKVNYVSLITAPMPKIENKPGFFARLFGKKAVPPSPVKAAPKAIAVLTPAKPSSVARQQSLASDVARAATGPATAVNVKMPSVDLKSLAKPVIPAVAKPIATQEVKKAEASTPAPATAEKKQGLFSRLFAKKAVAPAKASPTLTVSPVAEKMPTVDLKLASKLATAVDSRPKLDLGAKKAEANTPIEAKPVATALPTPKPAPSIFGSLFAKKEEPKPAVAPTLAKSEVSVLKPMTPAPQPMVGTKPVAQAPAPSAPKLSVFGSLFAKKEEPKPAAETPVAKASIAFIPAVTKPASVARQQSLASDVARAATGPETKPMTSPFAALATPVTPKPTEPQLKVEQKTVAKPESKTQEKGNIFTSLFGKEEEAGTPQKPSVSVLETIVAKTAPNKPESKKEKVPEERTGETLLGFATMFFRFSIAFIAISAAFLYVENMDAQNRVLGLANIENNAIQLHDAALAAEERQAAVKGLNEEIGKYQGGYVDNHQETIKKIVSNRMDWPAILKKLNEVTESVYEKNAISQYVQYNNYTYNTETGQFSVSGTLSDPLGKNLTKLAELEEAFRTFPKDPANPSDERKPYFYGLQEFKSFSKNFNAASGRFQSTFNLTLFTKEPKK